MTQHSLLQTPSSPVFGWAHALLASIGIIQPPNTSTFLLWQHSVLMPTTSISTYVHVIPILYWDWRDLSIHTFSVFIFDSLTFQELRKVQISFPLQANNLVGCSFMDTEIRYRTPGSDIEDFIVTEVVVKGPTNLGQFLWAQFLKKDLKKKKKSRWHLHIQWVVFKERKSRPRTQHSMAKQLTCLSFLGLSMTW